MLQIPQIIWVTKYEFKAAVPLKLEFQILNISIGVTPRSNLVTMGVTCQTGLTDTVILGYWITRGKIFRGESTFLRV